MSKLRILPAGVVVIAMSLFLSCATGKVQRDFTPARSLLDEQISRNERATLVDGLEEDSPYLKAHMLNGEVYVLYDRNIDTDGRTIRGSGLQLGVNRDTLNQGNFICPSSVQVNFPSPTPRLTLLPSRWSSEGS